MYKELIFIILIAEEMECEALFAESDEEEVEVLPSTSEVISQAAYTQTPKPVSSNYVNSTTPNQSLEVSVTPLPHSVAHTPVPEEYQPLPDSSSSLENSYYEFIGNNLDNNGSVQRTIPGVNIRYQPKPPVSPQEYYYPNYGHYRQYIGGPFHNNVIVLSDNRSYVPHPISYALPTNQAQVGDNGLDMSYNQATASTTSNNPPPSGLERPSRKLNISPRRRQSKESGTVTNLIEVSSEEEDNASAPKRKQHANVAGRLASTDMSTRSEGYSNAADVSRVNIKGEHSTTAGPSGGHFDSNTDNQEQLVHERMQCNPRNAHTENVPNPPFQIKQEQSNRPNPGCTCRNNHPQNVRQPNNCYMHNSNNLNCQSGSHHYLHRHHHHHHHHHHHQRPSFSQNTSSNLPGTSSGLQVKEEPNASQPQIKKESDIQTNSLPVHPVKTEVTEQPKIKLEPERVNQLRNEDVNKNIVKTENEKRRCCDVDSAGDRRINEPSPQPGPSTARTAEVIECKNGNASVTRVNSFRRILNFIALLIIITI